MANSVPSAEVRKRPRLRRLVQRAIGPLIFLVILLKLDLSQTFEAIRMASPVPLLAAYLLFLPSLVCRSARWQALMAPQGIRLGAWEAFSVYGFSILIGVVTPGRVGEFVKAMYLKTKGHSLGASFFSVFADRLLDMAFLLLFGAGALWALVMPGERTPVEVTVVLALVALGLWLCWFVTRGGGHDWMVRLLKVVTPTRLRDRVVRGYNDFSEGFRQIGVGTALGALLLTTLAWAANYSAVYLFSVALGLGISFLTMAGIAAVCALVTLVPISVMGLGTRDAALIALLAPYGVARPDAVALSILILSMLLCNAAICSFSLLTPIGRFEWRQAGIEE